MNNGGIEFPIVFETQHAGTNVPRSADVILPTCLLPLSAKIGFCTVVNPNLSTLYIQLGLYL